MALYDLAVLLDVTENFAFTPRDNTTFCNCYSSVFCAARGVKLPPLKANDQRVYLQMSDEWSSIGYSEAVTRANAGELVLAAVNEAPHGHITPCVESPTEDPTHLYVSAAGARNAIRCKLEQSFGNLQPDFFVHSPKAGTAP